MMTPRVVESSEEIERADKAQFALITFSNYIRSWVVYLDRYYGTEQDGIASFITRIRESDAFNQIQSGKQLSAELINNFNRGHLTLRAMKRLPVGEHPGLAMIANLWLPVQAYYALHGIGLATMIALNMSTPQTHSKFCAAFSCSIATYLPEPFCATCTEGPKPKDFIFHKLGISTEEVRQLKHLSTPEVASEIECFIGKSLSTTRRELLEVRFADTRKSKKKKKLTTTVIQQCCQHEHPTSICDLLYRLRLRSNYNNPDMYLLVNNQENAKKQYNDVLHLTELLIAGLDTITEKRIGQTRMQTLRNTFE